MEMLRYLCIFAICATVTETYEAGYLVDQFLANGGKWFLAAAASTFVPPPWKSCVNVTATQLPQDSECIIVNNNLTVRRVRTIQIIGRNVAREVEIRTRGPINEYTIKPYEENKMPASMKGEVDWEAAVNQPLCWLPDTRPRVFVKYRYVIAPILNNVEAIYLVGIKTRMPLPEYEHGIFTKKIMDRKKVQHMVDMMNWKNHDKMEGCREDAVVWPPRPVVPWFWNFFTYCLPRLHIKCAVGYDLHDKTDPINWKTPHVTYTGKRRFNYADTTTLFVTHNK